MTTFETKCGHSVRASLVKAKGGTQAGRGQVRVSGASDALQCGYKCL